MSNGGTSSGRGDPGFPSRAYGTRVSHPRGGVRRTGAWWSPGLQLEREPEIFSSVVDQKRFSPHTIDGATSRILLVVEDPDSVVQQAVVAGATQTAAVTNEHGWRVGRIIDPFGHEWEIGAPLGPWPPARIA